MENPISVPPSNVEKAFGRLFSDHAELSDYIFTKKGIPWSLDELNQISNQDGGDDVNSLVTIWLDRFVRAMRAEVQELDDSIPKKWWRSDKTDLQNVRVELVDIFHFLISAAQVAGLSGEGFINLYYQKRKLNYDRQIVGFKQDDNLSISVD